MKTSKSAKSTKPMGETPDGRLVMTVQAIDNGVVLSHKLDNGMTPEKSIAIDLFIKTKLGITTYLVEVHDDKIHETFIGEEEYHKIIDAGLSEDDTYGYWERTAYADTITKMINQYQSGTIAPSGKITLPGVVLKKLTRNGGDMAILIEVYPTKDIEVAVSSYFGGKAYNSAKKQANIYRVEYGDGELLPYFEMILVCE